MCLAVMILSFYFATFVEGLEKPRNEANYYNNYSHRSRKFMSVMSKKSVSLRIIYYWCKASKTIRAQI